MYFLGLEARAGFLSTIQSLSWIFWGLCSSPIRYSSHARPPPPFYGCPLGFCSTLLASTARADPTAPTWPRVSSERHSPALIPVNLMTGARCSWGDWKVSFLPIRTLWNGPFQLIRLTRCLVLFALFLFCLSLSTSCNTCLTPCLRMENGGFLWIPFVTFPGQHRVLLGITGRFSFEYPVWSPHETFLILGPRLA